MSTQKPHITIVGLGLIGGSIGLALREAGVASVVTGHDMDRRAHARATKLGAVDQTDWNLVSACEGADLVILATPLGALEATLKAIGSYLRPGCVVMDTASIKSPVLDWAGEILPEQVHFVGSNPILGPTVEGKGGLEAARADLFRNGLFCIVSTPAVDSGAVKLVADVVSVLGATPLFVDPVEHDGQLAGVEHLPAILAFALMETMFGQPTWRDLRKAAGPAFRLGTELTSTDAATHADLFLANRENLVRWMDEFAVSLASLRRALDEEESQELAERLGNALEERQQWLLDQERGQWQEGPRAEMPSRGSLLEGLLGGFWRRKREGEER